MLFTPQQLEKETNRLYEKLSILGWEKEKCLEIASLTLEINTLKKKKDAIILAHSYQSPEIVYGIADFVGDSYGLSKKAIDLKEEKIIFSSVYFMAETAKILNPKKEVFVPDVQGCSLAESIKVQDVKDLRIKHPDCPVVCYVNTTAEVKAECDVCVTSSNVLQIIEKLDSNKIVFIPDKYMAKNIAALTSKEIISWDGKCIVHEEFTKNQVIDIRKRFPNVKILAHTECVPEVIAEVDMAGGTRDMLQFVQDSKDESFMLVTECGLVDRFNVEFSEKKFVGSCALCPYMKGITLKNILQVLKNPREDQKVYVEKDVLEKAKRSLDAMMKLTQN